MRVHVSISGVVQGVFFRVRTQDQAQMLGLNGWVRNKSDGKVEAVFEGPRKNVGQMVEWCRLGPSAAQVDNVETHEEPEEGLSGFEIRY